MKAKKLKLNDLKVNSFVTALAEKNTKTVQGGWNTQQPCFTYGCSNVVCTVHSDVVMICTYKPAGAAVALPDFPISQIC